MQEIKFHPRYKCRACGDSYYIETIIGKTVEDVECFENVTTHICDVVGTYGFNIPNTDVVYNKRVEYVGVCDLVGYVEISLEKKE